MNSFKKRTAIRIAMVSLILAALASPAAWYFSRENAEESIVSLAIEQSNKLLKANVGMDLTKPDAKAVAQAAAKRMTDGIFDAVEIYDASGNKLAEELTDDGHRVEPLLPTHITPSYDAPSYVSVQLTPSLWIVRVFVPLRFSATGIPQGAITGYFEGIRVVPQWQVQQIQISSWTAALMVALSAIFCGGVLYPVVVSLSEVNEKKTIEVLDSHISMMESLGRAIAKRDSDTGAHNYRVAWLSALIAERMGIKGRDMQALIAGSFLHDVGKIGIPDAILLKPGKLDAAEFEIMRTHVAQGEEIVKGMGWLDGAHAVVSAHHEKWDGSGYPRKLSGTDIPLHARIFAIADVFDALCSKRPYKEAFDFSATMDILEKDTGSHFDPDVMAVFKRFAFDAYQVLAKSSEDDARRLLSERVHRHFEG